MNGITAAMLPFRAAYAAPDEDLAAKFLATKTAGRYTMADVLGL